MKTKIFKHAFSLFFLFFLVACSTKKNTFLSRNSHALSTRDNILYNGQIALDKGVLSLKSSSKDNFWKRLPIERMEIKEDNTPEGTTKNTDFEAAEAKATKAIQKHSMYIDGQEKNYQIDEAYLLLGKARYFDQRFFPALEAFNYILYKYPTSSNINQAKIWREKTNMRLGNDGQVLKNISKLLKEKKLKEQVISDANALMAESFLNLEEKDSAIVRLKTAEAYSKNNADRTRYRFILGQLYQELGVRDTALIYYQKVIDMNRKAEREYIIQAYAKKAQLFDFENGDANAFVERYNKLVADRENRPFKDIIYYEMGVFYDKNNDQELAKEFYNASLKSNSPDKYLIASNYRNLGNMYFKNTDYYTAAKYYDSTLVRLESKTREHIRITKVRKDLDEVIDFEFIAKKNDSILNVVAMSESDRNLYYEAYIGKLKKSDEEKRLKEEKQKEIKDNIERNNLTGTDDPATGVQQGGKPAPKKSLAPPKIGGIASNDASNVFYFYNPATVAFGKIEFKKKFGTISLNGNWRIPATKSDVGKAELANQNTVTEEQAAVVEKPEYSTIFYTEMLPKTQEEIDKIAKERNFVYYQLGIIYKEKFKEYDLASIKLEALLKQNPEEKLVLPSLYNLYKIYQITDAAKAQELKIRISNQYPDSRYAQIINNQNPSTSTESETTEAEYGKWYKLYQEEQFGLVYEKIDGLIFQYYGDEIVPKYELLRANTIGKLKGVAEYKKAMQFIVDNYPTTEEGKNAKEIVTSQIPVLERMVFTTSTEAKNWKILYKVGKKEDKTTKALDEKIMKFIKTENISNLKLAFDHYTLSENFVVIQGIRSEGYAKNVVATLKDDKRFKVAEPAIVISSDNYKVVQIKKNLEDYLLPKKAAAPAIPVVPQPVAPQPVVPQKQGDNPFSTDDEDPDQETLSTTKASKTRPPGSLPKADEKTKNEPNSSAK